MVVPLVRLWEVILNSNSQEGRKMAFVCFAREIYKASEALSLWPRRPFGGPNVPQRNILLDILNT